MRVFVDSTGQANGSLRKWYEFDRPPLNTEQIQLDDPDPSPDCRHEVVHVDAAYSDERLEIHLFIPRVKRDKYETVIWGPGVDRWQSGGEVTVSSYHDMNYITKLPNFGRIVCHPTRRSGATYAFLSEFSRTAFAVD
jgi:hypothetical protein